MVIARIRVCTDENVARCACSKAHRGGVGSARAADRPGRRDLRVGLQRSKAALEIGLEVIDIPPFVPLPTVNRLVSGFCGLDGALFGKLMRLHYPRRFAAATT